MGSYIGERLCIQAKFGKPLARSGIDSAQSNEARRRVHFRYQRVMTSPMALVMMLARS